MHEAAKQWESLFLALPKCYRRFSNKLGSHTRTDIAATNLEQLLIPDSNIVSSFFDFTNCWRTPTSRDFCKAGTLVEAEVTGWSLNLGHYEGFDRV
jgi:hypothetical protein